MNLKVLQHSYTVVRLNKNCKGLPCDIGKIKIFVIKYIIFFY